ncbi:MAG: hypothetical protein H6604_01840 [Flavobacteriales bacterium]|nr:hypothetical protein [Flavobacteriales bacterium]
MIIDYRKVRDICGATLCLFTLCGAGVNDKFTDKVSFKYNQEIKFLYIPLTRTGLSNETKNQYVLKLTVQESLFNTYYIKQYKIEKK